MKGYIVKNLLFAALGFINTELCEGTPGTGYLHSDEMGIPRIADEGISEHLWYACKFWINHLQDITNPKPDLSEALQTFLTQRLILWLEISVCKGQLQDIGGIAHLDQCEHMVTI